MSDFEVVERLDKLIEILSTVQSSLYTIQDSGIVQHGVDPPPDLRTIENSLSAIYDRLDKIEGHVSETERYTEIIDKHVDRILDCMTSRHE